MKQEQLNRFLEVLNEYHVDMLKTLSALVMKNTGSQYNTPHGSFDASKGDLRLLGVTAGTGGQSYMNFQKVPVKIVKEDKAEYIQVLVEAREQDSLEPFREFMMDEHIRNLGKEIEEYKQSQHVDPISISPDPINAFSDPIKQRLYHAVLQDGSLNYAGYAALIGVSEATVKRRLNELKKEGAIVRMGSNKTGHWEIKK